MSKAEEIQKQMLAGYETKIQEQHKILNSVLVKVHRMREDYLELNKDDDYFQKGMMSGEPVDAWVSDLSQQLYVNKEPTKKLRMYVHERSVGGDPS